ncbi:MAG: F0F1 ATP synthase subunit B [Eubacteriales bacterium]|nr:F0F1 ATP synthase subunit B [Eubacteriales bacterium]MDD4582858.1 F0F1 ATP synthase subunit B [Eubacteriales bacterium]
MELYAELIEFNWTLVFIWMTMLVLYLILKHFFFEKVHNFMVARENQVRESFENADRANRLADTKLSDYEMKIADLEGDGREIIKKAKIKADAHAQDIIDEANTQASAIIENAEQEIQRMQVRAVNDMKIQIATLAIMAAEKILEKQLDTAGHQELISGIIEEAGRSVWRM